MSMTVSISKGRTAILHDIREEISANVDEKLIENNEIFINELDQYDNNLVAYTDAHFQPYIDEYNEGKKNCRQIHETYTEHIAKENEKLIAKAEENKRKGVKASVRKPTQLAHEYVLQFGNRENNSTLPMENELEEKDGKTIVKPEYYERMRANKEGLREALEQLREKYPHAHVLLATYHQDEPNGTPHMHILVQFEGEEYSKGLSHQISISKALELDGLERSQNRGDYAINRWTKDISDNILETQLEKHLSQEREILGEHRKHEDLPFFREKAKAEAEALKAERELTQDTHDRLDGEIDRKREQAEALKEGGAYTNEQGEREYIDYDESIKHLESEQEHLSKNAFAYRDGGWFYDYDKEDGFLIPEGGIEQKIKDAETEAERITGEASAKAEQITKDANDRFDKMLDQIEDYKASQTAQIDLDIQKYAQEQKKAVQGELEGLRGELNQTRDAITKNNGLIQGQVDRYQKNETALKAQESTINAKTAQVKELDEQLTAKAASVERISKSFDRIAERVPEHDAPEPVIKAHKVIDQEKGFMREEVSHKEYSVSIPASSLEDAKELQREIGDLYTKHYTKETFKELSDASERQAKEQADRMIAKAQERIRQADNVLHQQQQIIEQANQQALRIKEKAERERTSILEKAKQQAQSIVEKAQNTLESLKNKIMELTGKRDKLQDEVDHTIEQAQIKAEAIIQEAHEQAGTDRLYEAINERLGIVPMRDVADARQKVLDATERLSDVLDDKELAMIKANDAEGVYNSLKTKVTKFDDMRPWGLRSAILDYQKALDAPHNPQEVLEDIQHTMNRSISRGITC